MNIDEFNQQHVDNLDASLNASPLLAPIRPILRDVRPDDLILYTVGRLTAARSDDLDREYAKETMPMSEDPDLDPEADHPECDPLFWRGVYEDKGTMVWKRATSNERVEPGEPAIRYPYMSWHIGRRLSIGLWRWMRMWSAYPHLAVRVHEQIDRGRVALFGLDALFMTRCIYDRGSFSAVAEVPNVLAWLPWRRSDQCLIDETGQFCIKRRDVLALRTKGLEDAKARNIKIP